MHAFSGRGASPHRRCLRFSHQPASACAAVAAQGQQIRLNSEADGYSPDDRDRDSVARGIRARGTGSYALIFGSFLLGQP